MHRSLAPWLLLAGLLAASGTGADVPKDLPYPRGTPDGEQVAANVYYANHFYAFENFMIRRHGRTMTVMINQNPDGSLNTVAVERYLNNAYDPADSVKARDLAIFRSGRLKGSGLLVTEYTDPQIRQSYMIWLPALRKVRRFAEPAHEDAWGGSAFTYGDVTLRRPEDEEHEIVAVKPFEGCLGAIPELENKRFKYAGFLPSGACRHAGKEVYVLKSTTRFDDWWYEFRVSFVDTHSFADYRTVYVKDGKIVKVIDRDWGLVEDSGTGDPRALFWKYWYGVDLISGLETWAVIPQEVIRFNTDRESSFWSERTLRRIRR